MDEPLNGAFICMTRSTISFAARIFNEELLRATG